jgi:hypothetical protein
VGLASAAALQACVFSVTLLRFDWCAEVARARRLTLAGAGGGDGADEPLLGGGSGGGGSGGKRGAGGGDEEAGLLGPHAPPAAVV